MYRLATTSSQTHGQTDQTDRQTDISMTIVDHTAWQTGSSIDRLKSTKNTNN